MNTRQRLVATVDANPGIRTTDLVRASGVTERVALTALSQLADAGVLVKSPGPGKTVRWHRGKAALPVEDPVIIHRAKAAQRDETATTRHMVQRLAGLEDRLAAMAAMAETPPEPVQRIGLSRGRREACAVSLFSDRHGETLVPEGAVPWDNTFSPAICRHRVARYWAGVRWLTASAQVTWQVPQIVIGILGDLITGELRTENAETSAMGPGRAILAARDEIVDGVRLLLEPAELFDADHPARLTYTPPERVILVCVVGNHGRTTDKMRPSTATDHSWEWVIYHDLEHWINDARVQVYAPRSTHAYLDVLGYRTHWHHGHDVRYGGGIGGIMIPANKAVGQWDQWDTADFHNFGHYHQYLQTKNVTFNGSIIGPDPYALSVKATPEDAQQAFYLIDSKRGKTMKSPVWVVDREAEKAL